MSSEAHTIAAALSIVVAAHKARLSDATVGIAEKLARESGATHQDIADAVRAGRVA
jgi:hypothetical protein